MTRLAQRAEPGELMSRNRLTQGWRKKTLEKLDRVGAEPNCGADYRGHRSCNVHLG